jgi:CBS domain-containing protein
MITIREIMTTNPYTLRPDDNIGDAQRLMAEHHVRHVPIVDGSGRLAGMVSQRDVLAADLSRVAPLAGHDREAFESAVPLRNIMTPTPLVVGTGDSLRLAAMRLQRQKIGCLPVVDGERLVGIITDYDFVGVAIDLLEQAELAEPEEES